MNEATRIMTAFIDAAWNKREADACDKYLAPHYLHYMPGMSEPMVGPEGYKQVIQAFTSAFPDLRMEIDEGFGEGDKTCVGWTAVGTHQGDFNGMAPTNRQIRLRGVGVGIVEGGQIVNVVSSYCTQELISQLT